MRNFMQKTNHSALRAIAERLLEAAERGLWSEPDPEDLEALKVAYLENEGMLEEGSA
ncbi:MAG: cobaltochelatase subunit CobN [Rubrobacteraceae bacterium]